MRGAIDRQFCIYDIMSSNSLILVEYILSSINVIHSILVLD